MSYLGFANWINLVIGLFVFVCLFLLISLLIRIIDSYDLNNLRGMTRGLGPLHKFLVLFFDFYERLMVIFRLE